MSKEPEQKQKGEGDRESARRYNERAQQFVDSEKGKREVSKADRRRREAERDPEELKEAESEALRRAREQDPQVSRDYKHPTTARRDGDD